MYFLINNLHIERHLKIREKLTNIFAIRILNFRSLIKVKLKAHSINGLQTVNENKAKNGNKKLKQRK